jgi:hypothetical protein
MSDNIVEFPSTTMVRLNKTELLDHELEEKRKSLLICLEDAILKVKENKEIIGGVCLLFEDDNTMHDSMGGDIGASNLYVMLDRLKDDLMRIICGAMGYDGEE